MENNWRFGVVGNIIHFHEPESGQVVSGTKEFSGGTKVYIDGKNWNNFPRTEVTVIGLNRFKKYQIASVNPEFIENVRFQLIRNTEVLEILSHIEATDGWIWYGRTAQDKRAAKKFADEWNTMP